jgi:hypothetical protein
MHTTTPRLAPTLAWVAGLMCLVLFAPLPDNAPASTDAGPVLAAAQV